MNSSSSRPRRPSSPPLLASERLVAELRPVIASLTDVCNQKTDLVQNILSATENLLRLRHTFIDDDNARGAKDIFRQLLGFQTLLRLLRLIGDIYDPSTLSKEDRKSLLVLTKDIHGVLAESLKDHPGNKRYFSKQLDSGGVALLESSLSPLCNKLGQHAEGTSSPDTADIEQFYGGLLAAALTQEMFSDFFAVIGRNVDLKNDYPNSSAIVQEVTSETLGQSETIENGDYSGVLDSPSKAVPAQFISTPFNGNAQPPSANRYRFKSARTRAGPVSQLASIYARGINTEMLRSFTSAHDTPNVRDLLDAIKSSKNPACIHFDLSRHGYSSLELPALGKPFPPSHSAGYTLAVWVRFDNFDPAAHTTIFGAFDSQACFVLAYIEKDTHNFILQTSMKGARPSVRFKSTVFELGKWYHICIVHKRPRPISSSRATLFVNGEFVEQLKPEYPSIPATTAPHRVPRVQAFLGTPEELATRLGKGVSTSRWSLASAILFDEAFTDDIIAVFYHLGPRYHGNFQDCLGSFQTYKASAQLNLRNESFHPGKEEQSDIVAVIRQKASSLIPENSVLLNISPMTILDDDDSNNVDESQLVKSLSKQAARNLNRLTKAGGNAVAINGSVPAINDALTQAHGVATLTGDPVVVVPQSLDDASWRIGGCAAPHLSLIEAASTPDSICIAVESLFEAVQDNWRNSEAMERENAYSILAVLLREKLGLSSHIQNAISKPTALFSTPEHHNGLAMEILLLILKFVGYDFQDPKKSIITNPLAYRVLLVDLDIWRLADLPLLEIYYSQFVTFCSESNNHQFNTKRLSRMRVVKKLLDGIKGENFTAESIKLFIPSLSSLVTSCMSAEIFRSLALFITYSIHGVSQKHKGARFDARAKQPRFAHFLNLDRPYLSKTQVGIEVLKAYTNIVCKENGTTNIVKFARTVTNKWLLYLILENNPEVVVLATTILARLLVTHGSSYTRKFADKSGGFVIMQRCLRRWWHIPVLWPICFAILFGKDVGQLDLDRPFDHFGFLDLFNSGGDLKVLCPEILPVITGMLKAGTKATVLKSSETSVVEGTNELSRNRENRRSMSSTAPPDFGTLNTSSGSNIELLNTVVGFLADIHVKSQHFRDFTITSSYVQELLFLLFPVVVGSDAVSADVELHSQSSGLTFGTRDVVIRPLSNARPVLRTTTVENSEPSDGDNGLIRRSSFVLVSSDKSQHAPSLARLHQAVALKSERVNTPPAHSIVQGALEVVAAVIIDQVLTRKDFELALHLATPPGFVEHQTYFESWVLRNVLSQLKNTILLNRKLLWEPRVLTNVSKLLTHLVEILYEGWFIDGAISILDFAGPILEYLQQPDVANLKSIRLCSQAISSIRSVVSRTVLLRLSEAEASDALDFLKKLTYWQTVILSTEEPQAEYLPLICYLLYSKLVTDDEDVRVASANLWRVHLVQKPSEMSALLNYAGSSLQKRLFSGFQKLVGLDDDSFLRWVDDQRDDLDLFFFGALSKKWEAFVRDENNKTDERARVRLSKRKDKLKLWNQVDIAQEEIIRKHDTTYEHWTSNISTSEHLKHQRSLQDQQDNLAFLSSSFAKMYRDLRRDNGILAGSTETKWRLDQTEGRDRMRLRITPDDTAGGQNYQPKRRTLHENPSVKLDTRVRAVEQDMVGITPTPLVAEPTESESQVEGPTDAPNSDHDDRSGLEGSYEMIEDPLDGQSDYEDKNRKVMRSLHRGDQVQHVCNISRIEGLEACEGLLILGKDSVYILDNFFQRADGEVVNVRQAPSEERDPYVRMISGRQSDDRRVNNGEHETRSWKWAEVISVSKRRFLFRDVALEIFFADGRSYLLTMVSPTLRNELFSLLSVRAPQINGSGNATQTEEMWRFEALRSQEDNTQFFRAKIANVFNQNPTNPATRKWIKGEMSNFHYLMFVNTMAGRTFNDLTQYPVFPWVLADYTSDELDLTNPKVFRDLSKPMGCQTPERESEYRSRYQSFAEMGDHNTLPFHYGTHYSSAMIVTSYLIRLQPFVKSYLLLQGGTFDHADRLFYSIPKAWESASRTAMTDVRELIPEFFYLPEFLVNSNKYDFGLRQSKSQSIDNVELPPWANKDPKIFIAKHREALESPYVTRNLHKWIDLVFGNKQKGEAALEAVNVFHHLSYQGAKDLDTIDDPVERLATIGIIHNFGQTPHQAFQKPHPQREEISHKQKRLDTAAESLTRLPFTLLDSQERVSSLLFSCKQDRLLCSAAFRLNIPPNYDKYIEWGFSDGSVRFYTADTRKLIGHFEHLHIGQLSGALFADSQTLITSGTDCTVSVWSFTSKSKSADLHPKATLFGHRSLVTTLAVSRSFSTILSASKDGKIMLWDLNRLEFVRSLPNGGPVDCARINDATGNIVVCRGNRIGLYTLNGDLLLEQAVCEQADDCILSCAFYEGVSSEWLERELLFTGHKRRVVNIWSKTIRNGRFELDLIRQLHHVDNTREDAASNATAGISCILPLAQSVYTGDEVGQVINEPSFAGYESTDMVSCAWPGYRLSGSTSLSR
ncbi:conserved hypothetical protein [Histoplasma capsulatum var. duboisii H88]|uniref:Beige/BEACH domain-containing protein n=1 Tax=Ajellomyces capsulatus (strain H88) TaxID=544711 RepID=F0ULK2_AJEC8|nr:conserved hypothetical protein [Histoplasma capsulatum var. duboisii H88]